MAQARDWPSEPPPRPLAAHEVQFPPYEIRTLGNGMRVVAVLHHEQPAVSIRLLVGAGSAQDPTEKEGRRQPDGVAARSRDDDAQRQGYCGPDRLHRRRSGHRCGHRSVVRQRDRHEGLVPAGMELVADVAHNPAFAPEEIARQKDQILSSLRVNAGDTGYIADTVFDRLVYGFHPYGLPGSARRTRSNR
jgi:zinc protease